MGEETKYKNEITQLFSSLKQTHLDEFVKDEVKNDLLILKLTKLPENSFFNIVNLIRQKCGRIKFKIRVYGDVVERKKQSITISFRDISFNGDVVFDNVTFKSFKFFGCDKIYKLSFLNSKFQNELKFTNSIFWKESNLIFDSCTMESRVFMNDCEFNSRLKFSNTVCKENTFFNGSTFNNKTIFDNITFEKLVEFHRVNFYHNLSFFKTNFFDRAIFSEATFHSPVKFIYNRVESNSFISFINARFLKNLDLSRSNLHCEINFWGAEIKYSQLETNQLQFYSELTNSKLKSEIKEEVLKSLRETYRLIKNEYLKSGDSINASDFRKKEMLVFKKEKKKFSESLILWLNFLSNNLGSNWLVGIAFTLIISLVSHFSILLILFKNNDITYDIGYSGEWIKNFIQTVNITNWKINYYNSDNGWIYLPLFIGRIFIAYGFYQTVVAFRKFSRK